jgi:hypothetical protein
MSASDLMYASLLLGAFALLAGGYGVLYTWGRMRGNTAAIHAAYLCYALQSVVSLAIVLATPLAMGWKLLVAASCLASLKIPPLTWRYLESIHTES